MAKKKDDTLLKVLDYFSAVIMFQEMVSSIAITLLLIFLIGLFGYTLLRSSYDSVYRDEFINGVASTCKDNLFLITMVFIVLFRKKIRVRK